MGESVRATKYQFLPVPLNEGATALSAQMWQGKNGAIKFLAYQYMRSLETHSDYEIKRGSEAITLHRGQFAKTLHGLFMELPVPMGENELRDFLEVLEDKGVIIIETVPNKRRCCSIFTITEDAEEETILNASLNQRQLKAFRMRDKKNKGKKRNNDIKKSSVYAGLSNIDDIKKSSENVERHKKTEEASAFETDVRQQSYMYIYKQNERDNNIPSIDIDYSTIGLRQLTRLQKAIDAAARRAGVTINATVEKYVASNLNNEIIDSATDAQLEELVDMAMDLYEQGKL